MRRAVFLLLWWPLACGCAREGDENLGLTPRRTAVDLTQLHRPAELVRALGQPGRLTDPILGARRIVASSSIKIEGPGLTSDPLEETYRLDTDRRCALQPLHEH